MNPLHLLWIIPLSAAVGFFAAALMAAGRDETATPDLGLPEFHRGLDRGLDRS